MILNWEMDLDTLLFALSMLYALGIAVTVVMGIASYYHYTKQNREHRAESYASEYHNEPIKPESFTITMHDNTVIVDTPDSHIIETFEEEQKPPLNTGIMMTKERDWLTGDEIINQIAEDCGFPLPEEQGDDEWTCWHCGEFADAGCTCEEGDEEP